MAVDSTTAFKNVSKQTTIPLPPGDLLTTDGIVQQLQITDQEALKPGNLVPFLASQSVKYNEIVNRAEIKTLEGDIPEYLFDDRAPIVSALSKDEQSALSDWHNEAKAMLSSQAGSGSPGSEDLAKEIEKFVDDALKNNPDALAKGHSLGAVDVLGEMMTGELYRETEESRKKYQEILATATDAGSVILAMTMRQSQKTAQLMGRAFEALKFQQEGMMKLEAEMNLKGKSLSQADMMKTNMDFARFSSDSSQIYQVIQKGMSDYERNFTFGNSMIKNAGEPLRTMIQNMKT